MVKIVIPKNLYDDFLREKEELDSTLSTIEILQDKKLMNRIKKGVSEIKNKESKEMNFEEIDEL